MTLHAEAAAADAGLADALGATLTSVTKVRGAVKLVPPGSLPNDGKVIADERPVRFFLGKEATKCWRSRISGMALKVPTSKCGPMTGISTFSAMQGADRLQRGSWKPIANVHC
jgi:hypothetical protein